MRIAEQVIKEGMSAGNSFMQMITDLIRQNGFKRIIETGSYLGLGTTRAIREALQGDEQVYSIEVNPEYHKQAVKNNVDSCINFMLGLSVAHSQIPVDVTWNVPDYVIVDHFDYNRMVMYRREVDHNVKDNRLEVALAAMDYKPDMVILDSAGHMGFIEFKYLMDRVKGGFILCLDDTNHVKHYDTMQFIKMNPDKFTVLFETNEKFGSAVIRVA